MSSEPALRTSPLEARLDRDVTLGFKPLVLDRGEVLGVVGGNGSGKTSFLRILAGSLDTQRGEIRLFGQDVTRLSAGGRFAAGLRYLPQKDNVFQRLTVSENITVSSMRMPNLVSPLGRLASLSPSLTARTSAPAATLSGGERQILALAMTFSNPHGAVYLLDEPFAGLSQIASKAIAETVRLWLKELSASAIIVEHSRPLLRSVCDRVVDIDLLVE